MFKPAYSEPVWKCGRKGITGAWVVAESASGIKYVGVHRPWVGLLALICCRPASGHTVRGVSETRPAINQGPHQIQN